VADIDPTLNLTPATPQPWEPADPNPLADFEFTGDIEVDAPAQLSALQQAFRDRMKAERTRFEKTTDSEHWLCVCFKTRADAEAFAAAHRLPAGARFVDGYDLTDRLGTPIDYPDRHLSF
jgi:hypothetical protein